MVKIMYYDFELGEIALRDGKLVSCAHARPYIARYRYRFSSDEEFLRGLPVLLRNGRIWAKEAIAPRLAQ